MKPLGYVVIILFPLIIGNYTPPSGKNEGIDITPPPKPQEILPPKPIIVAPILVRQHPGKTKMSVMHSALPMSYGMDSPSMLNANNIQMPPSSMMIPRTLNQQIHFQSTANPADEDAGHLKDRLSFTDNNFTSENIDTFKNADFDVNVRMQGKVAEQIEKAKNKIQSITEKIKGIENKGNETMKEFKTMINTLNNISP